MCIYPRTLTLFAALASCVSAFAQTPPASQTWSQVQRFSLSGGNTSVFGSALALSPDGYRLVVGAPFEFAGSQQGAAIAFERGVSGLWTQAARVDAPIAANAENFGASIAFAGNSHILVGDIREGTSTFLGAAHLYQRRTSAQWTHRFTWSRGAGVANDFMGTVVATAGDQALVSASGFDNGVSVDEGRVFVFDAALPLMHDGFE